MCTLPLCFPLQILMMKGMEWSVMQVKAMHHQMQVLVMFLLLVVLTLKKWLLSEKSKLVLRCLTHGLMGNAALLHRYGFTEPENPFDIVNVDLNMVHLWCSTSFSDRHLRSRLLLWRRLNFSGCISEDVEYFEISSNGEPQSDLLSLYIVHLPEDAFTKLSYAVDSLKDDGEAKRIAKLAEFSSSKHRCGTPEAASGMLLLTERVGHALLSLADMRESLYGSTSLKDDMDLLKECCHVKDRKLHHSLVLRSSERKVLAKLRTFSSGCLRAGKRKHK